MESEAEVQQFEVPTPFDIGTVNCYLIDDGEATLIDPGPATENAYKRLEAGLAEAGLAVVDVARVLVTHPHMDHFGLANRLVEESGASVIAQEDAVRQMSDPDGYLEREQAFFKPFLLSMGVPDRIVDTVVSLPEPYTEFRDPVEVERSLAAGDIVDIAGGLTAVYTPGHAPGSACFVSATDPLAFTGDHVLEHISPNPLLTLAPGTDDERTRSLPSYLDSLRTLRGTDATVGLAGHGDRVPDIRARIETVIDHHQHRKERIADMVAEAAPTTAYDLMEELFPDLPMTEVFLAMSEVIGHLDLLEDEGRVRIAETDGVWRYEPR
jgi:glyoxylase-like metal-dependent hydrolase (beta-lactamase superfamily II)